MPTERMKAFLDQVTGEVKWREAHSSIRAELGDHMAEHWADLQQEGWDENAAQEQAILAMGDAKSIGQSLNKLHKPQLCWAFLGLALVLTALGLVNIALTVNVYGNTGYFVVSALKGILLGLVMAAIIYRLDYTKLVKWSPVAYGAAWFMFILLVFFGVTVNGARVFLSSRFRISLAMLIVVLLIGSVVGIVYLMRRKGLVGLWIAGGLALLSLWPMLELQMSMALIAGIIYVMIFSLAIHWGYFGERKKRNLTIVYSAVLAMIAVVAIFILANPYRVSRIVAFLHPMENAQAAGWSAAQAILTLQRAQWIGPAQIQDLLRSGMETNILNEGTTNYMFAKIISDFGLLAGIAVTLLLGVFFVCGYRRIARVKNRYGCLLGYAALSVLCGQCVLHIMMNLALLPETNILLPFFSIGGTNGLVTWIMIGVVLAVWRRNNILTEQEVHEVSAAANQGDQLISWQDGRLVVDFNVMFNESDKCRHLPQKE